MQWIAVGAQAVQQGLLGQGAQLEDLFGGAFGRARGSGGSLVRDTVPGRESAVAAAESRVRSEEHTSELQSLMSNSYAVFCLKKKTQSSHTQQVNVNVYTT